MTHAPTPDALYAELHRAIGGTLFTVSVLDRAAGLARRVYTSHPESYPLSGTKSMSQGAWTEKVIDRAEVFVANEVAEFALFFPDHATIESLGFGAVLNVPISDEFTNGGVIGTVNILDRAGFFTADTVQRCVQSIEVRHRDLVSAMTSQTL